MLSKKIKIEDIEKFLSENPSFFIEHPQILQSLKFPSLKKKTGCGKQLGDGMDVGRPAAGLVGAAVEKSRCSAARPHHAESTRHGRCGPSPGHAAGGSTRRRQGD